MDLVEEYLRVVGALLPRTQRDDIVAELRDTVLTRIEARESELGRALTPEEMEAILREIGHPLVVAARHRQGPQHVVGPTLYPYWAFAVKASVTVELGLTALVFIASLIGGAYPPSAFGQAVGSGVTGAAVLIGVATAAAWLIERLEVRIAYFDRWRVRDLRGLEFAAWDLEALSAVLSRRKAAAAASGRQGAARDRHVRSSSSRALDSLASGTVLLLLLVGLAPFHLVGGADWLSRLGLGGALAKVDWRAFATQAYWPLLALALAEVLLGLTGLARPRAVRLRGLIDMAIGAGMLSLTGWIWFASPIAVAVGIDSLPDLAGRVHGLFQGRVWDSVATWISLGLVFIALGGLRRVVRGVAVAILGGRLHSDGLARPA